MSLKLASRVMVPLELLSIAGGNINGQNSFGNMVVFTKVKPRSSLIPGKSAKYVSNRNECFCSLKNTYKNIHRRTIHYSQSLERTQMYISSRINK